MSVRAQIATALEAAARRVGADGDLPDLELARARNPAHGDYASPVGLKLARALRRPPPEIAAEVATRVRIAGVSAEALGGYVNFRLTPEWLRELVAGVAADPEYGGSRVGGGQKVQVEFLSTNPTGPFHVGHGRGAILGDSLARLLEFTGHRVQREYYVNDQNTQAKKFGESILARYQGEKPPEGGYQGEYVKPIAEEARERGLPATADALRRFGIERMIEQYQQLLGRLRIRYDEWFFESEIWNQDLGQQALARLREAGFLKDRDGAVWFAPPIDEKAGEEAGEEEEGRVLIRKSGEPTYLASDFGYLLSRFERRGFQRVIEVWGADHHGHAPRLKAGCAALGIDPDRLVIILHQVVNLKEGRMSKRQGRFVTLEELVDRVGPDAVRYFYLLRSPDAMMEFDLELAVSQSNENPVFYAQYAHARLANLEPFAAERRDLPEKPALDLLRQPWELDLAREIAFWPETVEQAARLLEPHRLPYYVNGLADRVHGFYQAGNRDWSQRVVVDDPELTRARLELCRAARGVLKKALELIGVSAPDRM